MEGAGLCQKRKANRKRKANTSRKELAGHCLTVLPLKNKLSSGF
jgi:hypothetical protein